MIEKKLDHYKIENHPMALKEIVVSLPLTHASVICAWRTEIIKYFLFKLLLNLSEIFMKLWLVSMCDVIFYNIWTITEWIETLQINLPNFENGMLNWKPKIIGHQWKGSIKTLPNDIGNNWSNTRTSWYIIS